MANPEPVSEVTRKLSAYIAGALRQKLPAEVTERAKLHLLDTLAAMVSGSRLLPGKRAFQYIKTLGGTKEASVIGTRIETTAVNAALANGMFAHADETDDSHQGSITHPGASVVSAAMAVAQRNHESGLALLRAVVVGYDVGTRLTMSLDLEPFYYERGHHPPSFGGLFGAAAAAGALARLDAARVRTMLSYTAQQAAGLSCLFRDPEHVEKAFDMGGMPAHNGVQAALFAAHGFSGVADVFSGDRNFYWAFSPGAKPRKLAQNLGSRFEILKTSIKKWPVGSPIMAPLDALENLIRDNTFTADDVQKVVVMLAADRARVVDNRAMPDICLQHMVAVMLLDGCVTTHSSHDFKRMHDPRVLRLRKRIELIGSPKYADSQRRWHANVEITLKDGRKLEHYTRAARGYFLNPMTRKEETEKALDLLAPVTGKSRAQRLIATIWSVEKLKDARAIGLLCRPV